MHNLQTSLLWDCVIVKLFKLKLILYKVTCAHVSLLNTSHHCTDFIDTYFRRQSPTPKRNALNYQCSSCENRNNFCFLRNVFIMNWCSSYSGTHGNFTLLLKFCPSWFILLGMWLQTNLPLAKALHLTVTESLWLCKNLPTAGTLKIYSSEITFVFCYLMHEAVKIEIRYQMFSLT